MFVIINKLNIPYTVKNIGKFSYYVLGNFS